MWDVDCYNQIEVYGHQSSWTASMIILKEMSHLGFG